MSKVYKYIVDFKAKTDKFSKDVGGMKGMLKGAAVAAGALFAADQIISTGAAVADYAKEISAVKEDIQKLSGLQGAALNHATGQVKALADGYGADVKEAVQANNVMMKTFGVTSGETFDVLNKGFATAANSNGDFLKQVKEYSPHFEEAKISASEMVAIIAEGNKMGVFDDKTADSIKEGSIRLREMTKATKAALDGIGLSSTQIQKDISTGAKSMFDVMQDVGKQLKTLPEQSPAVGAALADIFGGPGEDAIQFIRNLGDVNTNLDAIVASAGEAAIAQKELGEEMARFHTLGAQVFGGTGTLVKKLKTEMYRLASDAIVWFTEIANSFIDVYNEAEDVRIAVQRIKTIFTGLWDAAKIFFEGTLNNFKALGKVVVAMLNGEFEKIPEIFKENIDKNKQLFLKKGEEAGRKFVEGWNKDVSKNRLENIAIDLTAAKEIGEAAGKQFTKGIAKGITTSKTPDLLAFNPYLGTSDDVDEDLFDTSTAEGRANAYSAALGNLDKQLQKSAEWNKVFGNSFQATEEAIELTKQTIETLIEDGFKASDPAIEQLKGRLEELDSVQHKLAKGVLTYANSMSEMSEQGAESFAELGQQILNTVREVIRGMIAQGVAAAMMNALKDVPFPLNIAAAATAAATASTLFNTLIPAFADGAIVSGPTLALTGEYPNAVNNPEWIGKRSDMLGDMKAAVRETGGGGGNYVFRFEDGALVAYLEHENRKVGGFA